MGQCCGCHSKAKQTTHKPVIYDKQYPSIPQIEFNVKEIETINKMQKLIHNQERMVIRRI